MNTTEAINELQQRINLIKTDFPEMRDYKEALEIAVRALERDTPEKPDKKPVPSKTDNDIEKIVEEWNRLQNFGIVPIRGIKPSSKRYQLLKGRIREYDVESVLEAIRNIQNSSFLKGDNSKGWTIKFDWFIKPSNFAKVLEGNYNNKKEERQHGGMAGTIKREAKPLIPHGEWTAGGNSETPFV